MDGYLPYLPKQWLGRWLLLVSLISIFNSIQNYYTLHLTSQVYNRANVTPLQARTFGTWTLTAAVVRLYAAYRVTDPAWYQLALCTYAIALGNILSEWLYFKSMAWGRGMISILTVAVPSFIYMLVSYPTYVK